MSTEELSFNGVNGTTGDYLLHPRTAVQLAELLRDADKNEALKKAQAAHQAELDARHDRDTQGQYGVAAGIDASNLAESGWGVILAHDADPALLDALKPLLDFRRQQATAEEPNRCQEFTGPRGYRPNDTKQKFLADHGVMAGMPADPDRGVPYYLLLVADPRTIPYRFQYELDVEYAVGRLWFEKDGKPDLDAFNRYARSVVAVESGKVPLPRRAVLFGVRNEGFNEPTQRSHDYLVMPLAEKLTQLQEKRKKKDQPEWKITNVPFEETTRDNLGNFLGGAETPALLFTASHGMGFDKGDPRMLSDQGALLCQDWPGRNSWLQPIPPEFYFAARNLPDSANRLGLIAFHFACYGAGTPQLDDYPYVKALWAKGGLAANEVRERSAITDAPFVARLSQDLLGHPRGGALAVIGHVERAWGSSFYLGQAAVAARGQTQVFESVFKVLMDGHTVGEATEYINQFYAASSVPLNKKLEDVRYGQKLTEDFARSLANDWTTFNDAGAYVVVGDPAVRLPVKSLSGDGHARPDLDKVMPSGKPLAGP